MRSVVQSLGVPGVQRPQLVDDPAVVPPRRALRLLSTLLAGRNVTEAFFFVQALLLQHLDVGEQELGTIGIGYLARCASSREIRGLPENPWIAQRAAADENARHTRVPEAVDQLFRLDAITAAKHRDTDAARDVAVRG